MALAISSGETLNLNLPRIIWKGLLENKITFEDYKTVDINTYNIIEEFKDGLKSKNKMIFEYYNFDFVIKNLNGKEIELKENGKDITLTLENVQEYIDLAVPKYLEQINNQINYIKAGLYSAIKKNLLKILNWKQLQNLVCGDPKFDTEEFKKHTEYEGEGEQVIRWFWK